MRLRPRGHHPHLLWVCPHPVVVDTDLYHRLWCGHVDERRHDEHVYLATDEPRSWNLSPEGCGRCHPDLRVVNRPV